MPTRYSVSRLKKITNNFTEKLREGGYGVVYKGKLQNGTLVAVKVLDRQRHNEVQFMNEVATIGHVHHVNLVRLLGYCFESFTSALVYEYMFNGSLDRFIFSRKDKEQLLRWEQLYSIALGAARGIAYLHQDCDKRIIHFDIKPHNILLDADFIPKVSDFGLAKLCGKGDDHISMTAGRGTPGYVAPEVCDRDAGPVTDKSDVYSFGMLLLEIVGGRKNVDWNASRSSQFYFPEWAFKLLESGELGMILRGREIETETETEDEKAIRLMTKVGLWCIHRPCMSSAVQMFEGNGDEVAIPPLPFNISSASPEMPAAPEIPLLSKTEEFSSIDL
jgi:serine/threonine protein kinase